MRIPGILLVALAGACLAADEKQIPQWTRFEAQFMRAALYANPVQEVRFDAEFTGPSGDKSAAPGFWDGGKTWRVRFSPNQIGRWTYKTSSSDPGLDGRTGAFTCVAYRGRNRLYRHGAIRVSANRRHFEHQDGVAFLWLGDTVWSGPMRAEPADWEFYLRDREHKKFSVIQFVSTNWKVDPAGAAGKAAFTGKERIAIHPEFYQRLDERVDAINAHGMIAAPVLLWASPNSGDQNPGAFLPEDQAELLARYQMARYGAHQTVWILNGDGDYTGEKSERWKRIGRAVFTGRHPGRLATLHPQGMRWMPDFFAAEPWFDFNGYQSGHRDEELRLRWLTEGPPSKTWRTENRRPDINLEPNYEAHNSRSPGSRHVFDAHDARRAAYWSLLVSPPAGVTYGAHGIWSWEKTAAEPLAHRGTGIAPSWSDALRLEGSIGMKHLMELFGSMAWWKLLPAQASLVEQPGREDARRFVAAAEAEDGTFSVAYLPEGGVVELRSSKSGRSRWYDPRTGRWSGAKRFGTGVGRFTAPGPGDWVLWREFLR